MRKNLYTIALFSAFLTLHSCLPEPGCMDMTAENYNAEAEENDGSCIPARDKLIGDYTYTCMWRDTLNQVDSIVLGVAQITESGTAGNAFFLRVDSIAGVEMIHTGVISAFDIVMNSTSDTGSISIYDYTLYFTGEGEWLLEDTVDMVLTLRYEIPIVDGFPEALRKIPQPYTFYMTKVD